MTKRLVAAAFSAIALCALLVMPARAAVTPRVSQCNGYTETITAKFNAFVGHRIEATSTVTHPTVYGACQVSKSTVPKVTLPSRQPGSLGEQVTVVKAPYRYSTSANEHVYQFSVKQTVTGVPLSQTFNFRVHYYGDGRARICFAGGSCGAYYN
jgi:hypothetical protein